MINFCPYNVGWGAFYAQVATRRVGKDAPGGSPREVAQSKYLGTQHDLLVRHSLVAV